MQFFVKNTVNNRTVILNVLDSNSIDDIKSMLKKN